MVGCSAVFPGHDVVSVAPARWCATPGEHAPTVANCQGTAKLGGGVSLPAAEFDDRTPGVESEEPPERVVPEDGQDVLVDHDPVGRRHLPVGTQHQGAFGDRWP